MTRYSRLFPKAEYILGVDAIMHVASPLFNTTDPQVMIDVRIGGTRIQVVMLFDFSKTTFFRALCPVPREFSMLLSLPV